MINFISNLPEGLRTGGFSAMSAAAYAALRTRDEVAYIGPINPAPILLERMSSKVRRSIGSPGDFFFFSPRRLSAIAREVASRSRSDVRVDFFHGFTPWIQTRPRRPYFAWCDCTFRDYINIYHHRANFRQSDLARIERLEASWLKSATAVLFTTDWAASRAVHHYGLDPRCVCSVGMFGEIEMPPVDAYRGDEEFAFISTNFEAKGGYVVLAAFQRVRAQRPDARLTVVGDAPRTTRQIPGVTFAGYLRKENEEEAAALRQLLGRARGLVLPTRGDIAPLLIVEAGYFGCPAIATRDFAIPELVEHGKTGLLVDDPRSIEEVAAAMERLLVDGGEYRGMRRGAWERHRQDRSKARFVDRMCTAVFGSANA